MTSEPTNLGERLADKCASVMGSWRFIIGQSSLLTFYVLWNTLSPWKFDPFPFIFLNLTLSFQAAYAAPIIMMAQNRQESIDRQRSIDIYTLEKGEHETLFKLEQHLDGHFHKLNKKMEELEARLDTK